MKLNSPTSVASHLLAPLALLAGATAAPQYTSFSTTVTPPTMGTDLGVDDLVITPDGRYAIYRDMAVLTNTRVVDLETGEYVLQLTSDLGPDCGSAGDASCSAPCNDALATTNSRAISLGQQVKIIDLTAQPPVELASLDCGIWPRDVALSGDGSFAIIRGGRGVRGGTYVVDMGTGATLLFSPSQPRAVGVQLGSDLAAASDFHGVSLAWDAGNIETDVLIVEFDPASGGGPQVVLDTAMTAGFLGDPMDVAISPDGQFATVRTSEQVALFRLDGVNTALVRTFDAFNIGLLPFGTATTDTVVSTNTLWATISVANSTTADGLLNVQNLQTGQNWFAFLDGTPRDLVLTPDNESLLVHTGEKIYRFDLTNLPATPALSNSNFRNFLATASGLLAGIDSVEATNERAIVMAPSNGNTRVRIFDLTQGTTPNFIYGTLLDGGPLDVAIAEDSSYALAVTQESYVVVDVRTGEEQLRVQRSFPAAGFPWSDAAAIHPKHLAAGGYIFNNGPGWMDTVDLVSRENLSCRSLPNSTGQVSDLFANGSTRVDQNDLTINVRFLPPNSAGIFFLADGTGSVQQGGGILCLGGAIVRLPLVVASPEGVVTYPLDLQGLPPAAGMITAGTTRFIQLAHRDIPSAGAFNYSNSSELLFE